MTGSSINGVVKMLRKERVRGATWSARVAAEALIRLIESGVKGEEFIRAAGRIRKATPSMASVYNVTSLAEERYRLGGAQEALRVLRAFLEYQEECKRSICSAGQKILWEDTRIATLSYSSNVFNVLLRAKNLIAEVYVLESRPGSEGARLAADLELNGFEVKLLPDSSMTEAVKSSDLILVGADMVTVRRPIIVNKIGTNPLARIAKAMGKPLIAIFESYKIHPTITPSKIRLTKRPYHVGGYGTIRTPIFDKTPGEYVSKALTEHGEARFTAEILGRLYRRFIEKVVGAKL